ncbi:MAG: HWE histidine kinase domain-containing protein [Pseudomonadota bacterium]
MLFAGVFELQGDDYRYVLANANTASVYGKTPEQMQGLSGADLGLSPRDIRRRVRSLRNCWESGAAQTLEYPFSHGGKESWYLGVFTPLSGDRPRVSFVLVEVTDRKRAEFEAEHQRRRLQVALEATGLGLWEYEIAADEVIWDARTRDLFGVDPDVKVDLATFRSRLHPDEAREVTAAYENALRGENGGNYATFHRVQSKDGAWRWVRGSGQVIFEGGAATRIIGTVRDVTEEVEAREQQKLLMDELNHRVKNNLATVQSIAMQTARRSADLPSFVRTFEGRILALARTHDVLTATAWSSADLHLLLRRELSTFSDRLDLMGPAIRLHSGEALAVGLIVHELATNATKYGAWSRPEGKVQVHWRLGGGQLALSWREAGGPPAVSPSKLGFGARLIERLVQGDLRGRLERLYLAGGFSCEIEFPLGERPEEAERPA